MGDVVRLSARQTQGAKRKASHGMTSGHAPASMRDHVAGVRDTARARFRAADRLRIALRECMDLGIPSGELYDAVKWAVEGGE